MPLASLVLRSGRDIELTNLEITSTYVGLLEGYPTARMNDGLLARLASRKQSHYWTAPVHVIDPPRRPLDTGSTRPHFGPPELLPPVYCRGSFVSRPVDEALDAVLHRSYLDVVWFQEDVSAPVDEFVAAALSDLAWDSLAEDMEL